MGVETRSLTLMRHARSKANEDGVIAGGNEDVPLVDEGIKAARQLGLDMRIDPATVVFAGSLQRQRRTAELVSGQPRHRIKTAKSLNERLYGRFNKKTLSEAPELLEFWQTPHGQRLDMILDDVEPDRRVLEHRDEFDQEVKQLFPDQAVFAVSSEDKLVTWLNHLGIERLGNLDFVELEGDRNASLNELHIVGHSEGVLFRSVQIKTA
jgi:broad specificity phosphatase PhoE